MSEKIRGGQKGQMRLYEVRRGQRRSEKVRGGQRRSERVQAKMCFCTFCFLLSQYLSNQSFTFL
jgi:hypothetical protein